MVTLVIDTIATLRKCRYYKTNGSSLRWPAQEIRIKNAKTGEIDAVETFALILPVWTNEQSMLRFSPRWRIYRACTFSKETFKREW